jgi:VWFA-related protein
VKLAAKQFIERRLGANDLMAVVHTAGPTNANQEFTSNKRLLLSAVDKTMGQKLDSATANKTQEYNRTQGIRQQGDPLNDPDDAERAFQARNTLETLRNVADWFGAVRGRRKAILFVSEGIDTTSHITEPVHVTSTIIDATRDAIASATRSNVAIYGIDPRGLTIPGDESIEIACFDDTSLAGQGREQRAALVAGQPPTLSEETGGFAVVNQNPRRPTTASWATTAALRARAHPPDARPGGFTRSMCVTRPGSRCARARRTSRRRRPRR